MSKIGLVMGGGGTAGIAFELATLSALSDATGWVPTRAEVIVGTSAGAWVGALLRAAGEGADIDVREVDPDVAFQPNLRFWSDAVAWFNPPRFLPGVRYLGQLVLSVPTPFTTTAMTATARRIFRTWGNGWPVRETWFVAFDLDRMRRVVFGRDARPAVVDAMIASSTIPFLHRPFLLDGRRYLDGGVASVTNADLLSRRRDLDAVVILAPMSAREGHGGGTSLVDASARVVSLQTAREAAALRAVLGIPVVVLAPGEEIRRAMGRTPLDLLDGRRAEAVIEATDADMTARFAGRDGAILRELLTARDAAA